MTFKPLLLTPLAAMLLAQQTAPPPQKAPNLKLVINTSTPHVYELRTYHCFDGRLDALKARFRDHTIEIFKRHGIESVAYWTPQDPETSKNTLVYLLVHPSHEAAMANWAAFMADPEWKKVAADSEKDGKIVQKVDRLFLDPTDFSPLK